MHVSNRYMQSLGCANAVECKSSVVIDFLTIQCNLVPTLNMQERKAIEEAGLMSLALVAVSDVTVQVN